MVMEAPRTMQKGDVVTVRDAANDLGIHYVTLYRWVEAGKVVYIRFGGILFIPVLEVERLKREKQASR